MGTTHLLFGPPGTGKTTTCKHWVERAAYLFGPKKVLVASFTRAAAAEIASRLPDVPRENVGTLHSICYRALDYPELTEGKEADFNAKNPQYALTVRKKRSTSPGAVDDEGGRGNSPIDEPFEERAETRGDHFRAAVDLLRARRVPREHWHGYLLSFHEAYTAWKQAAGLMDFSDLLETCLDNFQAAPGDPGAIFFDEAQDASQLQADLLHQWGQSAQRLILAGDDDQAIYFWAGADARSFLDFPCAVADKRYLRQSHRVPRAVHQVAERWVKRLHHRENKHYDPRDADGFLRRLGATWQRPEQAVDLAEHFASRGKTVMLMAACSYLLNPTKTLLRERGLPFHNPWRAKRGDWNPLLSGAGTRTMPVDRLLAFLRPDHETWGAEAGLWRKCDLWAWASLLESRTALLRGAKKLLAAMKKQTDAITPADVANVLLPALLSKFEGLTFASHPDGIRAVRWWLAHLIAKERAKYTYPARVHEVYGGKALRQRPLITLGTGHSLKGSEADVAIVFPDLSSAGWKSWVSDPEGREGILRLFYVMMTRAREGLVLCSGATPRKLNLAG
jgi:superfamily I DNA/RNA helicase